jgi:hypothetical protein
MSRTRRGTAAILTALAPVALLAGCTADDGAASAGPPSAAASSAPAPSPTPESKSPEHVAVEQAEPLVTEYFRTSDIAAQDPASFRMDDFKQVAITQALLDLENRHIAFGDQGLHQTGTTTLVSVEFLDVDLTNKPKATPPTIPTVLFTVCYDTSDLDVLDSNGNSARPSDIDYRGVARFHVSDYEYPHGPWLVSYIEHLEAETC